MFQAICYVRLVEACKPDSVRMPTNYEFRMNIRMKFPKLTSGISVPFFGEAKFPEAEKESSPGEFRSAVFCKEG